MIVIASRVALVDVHIFVCWVFVFVLNLESLGLWLLLTGHGGSMHSSYLLTPLVVVVRSLGPVSPSKLSQDFGNSVSSLSPPNHDLTSWRIGIIRF